LPNSRQSVIIKESKKPSGEKQMTQKTIEVEEATELMQNSNGQIFTVMFIKKTNGEYREMICRLGVSLGVNGRGRNFTYEPEELLGVYDMQKHAHRMVNLRSVVGLNIGGESYKVGYEN
jgi:hypothetical protein